MFHIILKWQCFLNPKSKQIYKFDLNNRKNIVFTNAHMLSYVLHVCHMDIFVFTIPAQTTGKVRLCGMKGWKMFLINNLPFISAFLSPTNIK